MSDQQPTDRAPEEDASAQPPEAESPQAAESPQTAESPQAAESPQTAESPQAAGLLRRPLLVGVVVVVALFVVISLGSGLLGGTPSATNPIPATVDSIDRGQSLFANDCARCHGVDARGGGPDSATTAVPPPALTGPSSHLSVHSDSDLFSFIHDGLAGGMPSWGTTLTDDQIWDVINFLHSLNGSG